MKLEKFKEKNYKKISIIIFTLVCMFLVISVILYRTFAIFKVDTNQNIMNGSIEDPGDIYFAFYKKDENGEFKIQKEMPQKEEGYMLDKQSFCGVNGSKDEKIIPSLDRDTWSIVVTGVTTSRTKCNLYFTKTYDDTTLYDLSGNGYNGTFYGTKVQKDGDLMGMYFDGTDDFVDVADLPESIDWESGFTVETEFKETSLSGWNRIFDFGVGMNDNNLIMALGTQGGFTHRFEVSARYNQEITSLVYNDFLDENTKYRIKVIFDKLKEEYVGKVYIGNTFFNNEIWSNINFTKNINRTSNYLGKSNWTSESSYYFSGYIYSLKFTDSKGNIILWYDF